MERQKLPNATISLILGILSFIGCCCFYGVPGILLAGTAFFLANKDEKTYAQDPDLYDNFSQVKTAKVIAIIGIVLSLLMFAFAMYLKATGKDAEFLRMLEEMQAEMENQ